MRAQFNAQKALVLEGLANNPRGKSIKTKDYVGDLIEWEQSDTSIKLAIAPTLYEVIISTAREAMLEIGQQPSTYDPFAKAVREYLDARSFKIAGDVNDETEKQLRAALTEGINAGESGYTLRSRVEAIFGFAIEQRADLIASTEVARAQSYADISAWGQSGVIEGKEWHTAEDEMVCPFCGPMDGRIIGIDENFFDKGDVQHETSTNRNGDAKVSTYNHSYDDVPGAPLHPRCRCVLLPVRVMQ